MQEQLFKFCIASYIFTLTCELDAVINSLTGKTKRNNPGLAVSGSQLYSQFSPEGKKQKKKKKIDHCHYKLEGGSVKVCRQSFATGQDTSQRRTTRWQRLPDFLFVYQHSSFCNYGWCLRVLPQLIGYGSFDVMSKTWLRQLLNSISQK